jgi:hypothetical protein
MEAFFCEQEAESLKKEKKEQDKQAEKLRND